MTYIGVNSVYSILLRPETLALYSNLSAMAIIFYALFRGFSTTGGAMLKRSADSNLYLTRNITTSALSPTFRGASGASFILTFMLSLFLLAADCISFGVY